MNVDDERIIERLDRIADGVDKLILNFDKLVNAVPKPASLFSRVIEILITVGTIAGVLSAIDIIKNWLGG